MYTRLLFLDFDGVLHPFFPRADLSDAENAHFANLPALEALLRQHPHVAVVISSSWRHVKPLETLKSYFSEDLRDRILGITPDLATGADRGDRQREVEAWLAAHGHADTPWVALDDVVWEFLPGAAVVVAPDTFGLLEATHLMKALHDPAAWAQAMPVPAVRPPIEAKPRLKVVSEAK